jgi:hypothetical protein
MLLSGAVARVLGKCLGSWTPGLLQPCQLGRRLSDSELLSEHAKRAIFPRFTPRDTRPPSPPPPTAAVRQEQQGLHQHGARKGSRSSDGTRGREEKIDRSWRCGRAEADAYRSRGICGWGHRIPRWLVRQSRSHLIPRYSFTVLYASSNCKKCQKTCISLRQSWVCAVQEDGILDRSRDSHVHCIGQFRGPSHPIPSHVPMFPCSHLPPPQFTRCA